MNEVRVVLSTFPDEKSAREIAGELVRRKLVACVNLLPGATSIYEWEGVIREDAEILAVMKTNSEAYPALEQALRELHPYEVPEILALPVGEGSDAYLDFVANSVQVSPAD